MTENPLVGSAVIVYRQSGGDLEFLILHRTDSGPDFEGDWAWGPPAGHRKEEENAFECAERELFEETRLALDLRETNHGLEKFKVFVARASHEDVVILSKEHDRFEWADLETVLTVCKPKRVASNFVQVARDVLA